MNRAAKRRYRRSVNREVRIFSELNQDQRAQQIARVLTASGLEQARREAEAAQEHRREAPASPAPPEVRHA